MSFDCSEDNELEELQKSIQEERGIADDEKDQAIRERARERIIEYRERIDALENEREELEEGTSLKESEKYFQEIWFHSLSCCSRSRNNDWSDCERIDENLEICCQRSWKWF